MKYVLRLFASVACLMVFASCGDDPVSSPGSGNFTPEYRPTLQSMDGDILSVSGVGNGELYALGPAILHYDGARWGTIEPPRILNRYNRFNFVQAFHDGSIVLSDGQRTFLRKDGVWADISDADRYADAMWGSAADNVYTIAYSGVRHFDGSTWNNVELPVKSSALYAVGGRSNGDVTISGRYGQLFQFDGSEWSVTQLDSNAVFDHISVTESGRVFGSTYSEVYELTGGTPHLVLRSILRGIVLCADHEVLYAAGRLSLDDRYFVIARLEDGIWQNVALERGVLQSMWAGNGSVIAGGWNNFLWRGSETGGQIEKAYTQRHGFTCAANIDGALFAGGSEVYRYQDGVWTNLNKAYVTTQEISDIAGRNQQDLYAVGTGMLLHYDGSAWAWINGGSGDNLTSVWVDDIGDVWAGAAYYNSLYHLHGGTWTTAEVPFSDYPVYDLWGTNGSLFAVGGAGMAAVRKDGVWHRLDTHTNAPLFALWGISDHCVYAVNRLENQLLMYDGREWKRLPVDNAPGRYTISLWGSAPSNMFVVDNTGSLLHYDGHGWQTLEGVFSNGLNGVCGIGNEAVGFNNYGVVSYRR